MNEDLISIIMPTYKCGRFIAESIKSVQAQTFQNWELIIVDDCSGDDTIGIVLDFQRNDDRIKVFQNPSNMGAAISRNAALREAKGRWIAFLDSDDLWEPEKLEKQIKFMTENGYSFSYTRYAEVDEDSEPLGIEVSGPKHVTKAGMYAFCWLGCLTVMYDSQKVGLIQVEDIKKNNDYAMWLKVCKKADCYLLDECLAKYRRGRKGSISTHGYTTLIKWHYKLWREAEKLNSMPSIVMTGLNLVFGVYKKMKYVKKTAIKIYY